MSGTVKLSRSEVGQVKDWSNQWFWFYCQMMMPPEWYDEKFHFDLANFLQYGPHDKLVVLPRSFLKTTIVSTLYPLWRSLRDTDRRTLITGNSSDNAAKTVHTIRGLVESHPLIQVLWPEAVPRFDKVRWSDKCAELARKGNFAEGTFESAGVGSNIIRRHFNSIIEDDTVSPKKDELTGDEALPSRDDIEKAVGFHKLTIPLLVNFAEDERIVVGTRWASYDLINYIYEHEVVEQGGRFGVFNRPAMDEEGNPLYKRYSPEVLEAIKKGMGTYMFHSLYLNMPLAKEFMKFNPDWFRYYEGDAPSGITVVTLDPADPPTGKRDQCYSAGMACTHTRQGVYVRGYFRVRESESQIINRTLDLAGEFGAIKVRVEEDRYANLKYGLRDEIKRRRLKDSNFHMIVEPVKARKSEKSKDDRILGLTPLVENGCLFLRRGMRELEQEMVQFPNGQWKDLLDALAWQLPDHRTDFTPSEMPPADSVSKYRTFSHQTLMESLLRGAGRELRPFGANRIVDHLAEVGAEDE